jgi:hypothetical protein
MQTPVRSFLALLLVVALAGACGETVYEFDDLGAGGDGAARAPREKSNSQFLRGVYADLLGRTPEVYDFVVTAGGAEAARFPIDEQELLLASLDAVGDPTPLRNLVVAGIVRADEAAIPDKADVGDAAGYIAEQFRRLLGREPGEYELRAFVDAWNADPAVNPRTVVRAIAASREYQSF